MSGEGESVAEKEQRRKEEEEEMKQPSLSLRLLEEVKMGEKLRPDEEDV